MTLDEMKLFRGGFMGTLSGEQLAAWLTSRFRDLRGHAMGDVIDVIDRLIAIEESAAKELQRAEDLIRFPCYWFEDGCDGSGKVDDEKCEECNGTGVQGAGEADLIVKTFQEERLVHAARETRLSEALLAVLNSISPTDLRLELLLGNASLARIEELLGPFVKARAAAITARDSVVGWTAGIKEGIAALGVAAETLEWASGAFGPALTEAWAKTGAPALEVVRKAHLALNGPIGMMRKNICLCRKIRLSVEGAVFHEGPADTDLIHSAAYCGLPRNEGEKP